MNNIHYMTREGLDEFKRELDEALAKRPEMSAAIAEAREKGDLSENAEYDAAREAQGLLEFKISKLKNIVAHARVLDKSHVDTDTVQLMNKVKVKNVTADMIMEFTIVSEAEADFAKAKLAVTTPIVKAIMGHKVGDVVEAEVPSGTLKLKVLEIGI